MTPYYSDDWLTVYHGDTRAVMAEMEPDSVNCVVTSPPYWGLRDYGEPGQLGLEPTPEAYVAAMVDVFREVRRVLRSDGTVWLNLGDSYAAARSYQVTDSKHIAVGNTKGSVVPDGLKHKDLVGIPWRVAFALQADGWYLRSDIIWSKPNPMPESVTDRPTKSHEYLFLMSKSPRYYFDADAVREEGAGRTDVGRMTSPARLNQGGPWTATEKPEAGRNLRSVWTIATAPYPGAHFATFPPKLVEPCIKAGTSERGVCPECGDPWVREVERADAPTMPLSDVRHTPNGTHKKVGGQYQKWLDANPKSTTGWRPPDCDHRDKYTGLHAEPAPATVLDPFAGSGTTGMVAQSLSRRAVLIDLSMDYLGQLMDRNRDIPLGLGA